MRVPRPFEGVTTQPRVLANYQSFRSIDARFYPFSQLRCEQLPMYLYILHYTTLGDRSPRLF